MEENEHGYGNADYLNNLDIDAIVALTTPPSKKNRSDNETPFHHLMKRSESQSENRGKQKECFNNIGVHATVEQHAPCIDQSSTKGKQAITIYQELNGSRNEDESKTEQRIESTGKNNRDIISEINELQIEGENDKLSKRIEDDLQSCVLSLPEDRKKSDASKVKETWREVCDKWGMVISRDILYTQDCFLEDDINVGTENVQEKPKQISNQGEGQPRPKMIGSNLVISRLDSGSPAAVAGLVRGDVIYSIYGMKDPCPNLLFGIMSNSTTFQMTVRRESGFFDNNQKSPVQSNSVELNRNNNNLNTEAEENHDGRIEKNVKVFTQPLDQGRVSKERRLTLLECHRTSSIRVSGEPKFTDRVCTEESVVDIAEKQDDMSIQNSLLESGNKKISKPSTVFTPHGAEGEGTMTDDNCSNKDAALPKLSKKSIPTEHSRKQTSSCSPQTRIEEDPTISIDTSPAKSSVSTIAVQASAPLNVTGNIIQSSTLAPSEPQISKPLSDDLNSKSNEELPFSRKVPPHGVPMEVPAITGVLKSRSNRNARKIPVEVPTITRKEQGGSSSLDSNVNIDVTVNRRVISENHGSEDAVFSKTESSDSQTDVRSTPHEMVGRPSTSIRTNNLHYAVTAPITDKTIALPVIPSDLTVDSEKALYDLQVQTGCDIVINKNIPQNSVTITCKGTRKSLEDIKIAVEKIFPARAKKNKELSESAIEKQLLVPDIVIKNISSMLQELTDESGANIHILPSTERSKKVTLTGEKRNVQKLEQIIKFLISNPAMDLVSAVEKMMNDTRENSRNEPHLRSTPTNHVDSANDGTTTNLSQSSKSRGLKNVDEMNLIDLIESGYDTCSQGNDDRVERRQASPPLNMEENRYSEYTSESNDGKKKPRIEGDTARHNLSRILKTKNKKGGETKSIRNDEEETKKRRKLPAAASIVTAAPASVLRQTALSAGTLIQSTSSKAGLSIIRSTKLKRLWPDSSLFCKRIMKWSPPKIDYTKKGSIRFRGSVDSADVKTSLTPLPNSFQDTTEMKKLFSPHILEEGRMNVHQEFLANSDQSGYWTRSSYELQLRSCTPVEKKSTTTSSSPSVRMYEFTFAPIRKRNQPLPPSNLGELFALYSPSWKHSSSCLAYIGSNDINSIFLADQKIDQKNAYDLLKLWVCVSRTTLDNTGWLPESELPPKLADGSLLTQTMFAINIGTCTDITRQYEAIRSLACVKNHLQRAIFCPENTPINYPSVLPTPRPVKPTSVSSQVWKQLDSETNPFQLSAIEKVMTGKAKENVTLLQGPPGTGKTTTIVSLVSALLNGTVPASGAKASGTRVQVGTAFSKEGKSAHFDSVVARRILVCAPSNQAVDELAWKIHKGAIGPCGITGGFNLIRFGMLPGETRHDGRGKVNLEKPGDVGQSEKDRYLSEINLDNLVRNVARGKEVNVFAYNMDKATHDDNKRNSRFINYNLERQRILSQTHVVCCTLSGAGSKAFVDAVSRDEFPHSEFDAVIIDEACQGSEASCLIPLKFNPNAVVIVGDPKQLPVMAFARSAERCKSDRPLFERLHQNGWPINLLRIQYRMHESINAFPSKNFYEGNLITGDSVKKRRPAIWHHNKQEFFPPYLLWDHDQGAMMRNRKNRGLNNDSEAILITRLLNEFSIQYSGVQGISIGIISFYNNQVAKIREKLNTKRIKKWMRSSKITLKISTVDGFQGSEEDIIILSCVRSKWMNNAPSHDIGFLNDCRRVNVALTRARHSLWIVGNFNVLKCDPVWNKLIEDAWDRKLLSSTRLLKGICSADGSYTCNSNKKNKKRKGGGGDGGGGSKKKQKKGGSTPLPFAAV